MPNTELLQQVSHLSARVAALEKELQRKNLLHTFQSEVCLHTEVTHCIPLTGGDFQHHDKVSIFSTFVVSMEPVVRLRMHHIHGTVSLDDSGNPRVIFPKNIFDTGFVARVLLDERPGLISVVPLSDQLTPVPPLPVEHCEYATPKCESKVIVRKGKKTNVIPLENASGLMLGDTVTVGTEDGKIIGQKVITLLGWGKCVCIPKGLILPGLRVHVWKEKP